MKLIVYFRHKFSSFPIAPFLWFVGGSVIAERSSLISLGLVDPVFKRHTENSLEVSG